MVQKDGKKQVLIMCYDSITFVVMFVIETMGWNLQGLSRGLRFNNVFPELEFRGFQGSEAPTNFLTHPLDDFISLSCPIPLSWSKRAFPEPCICIQTCFFFDSFKDYSTRNHTYACLPHTHISQTENLTSDNITVDENYET